MTANLPPRLKAQIEAAHRFRTACEAYARSGATVGCFDKFPAGCCGSASQLLAQYLFEIGLAEPGELIQVSDAWFGHMSHAWLETAGFALDITRDQFPGISCDELCVPLSDWHLSAGGTRNPIDEPPLLEGDCEHQLPGVPDRYRAVRAHLP